MRDVTAHYKRLIFKVYFFQGMYMNKILKGLLAMALAVSSAAASSYTNKTFLTPRPQGVNLPMEYTAYAELIGRKSEEKFGGNFQVTGFYQASTNGDELAKYFLVNNKSTITLTRQQQPQPPAGTGDYTSSNVISTVTDVDLGYLIHQGAGVPVTDTANKTATVNLDPKQTAWGVRIDYFQDLGKILKGLYIYANLPIVHVENNPEIIVNSSDSFLAGTVAPAPAGTPSVQSVVQGYFSGSFANPDPTGATGNAQAALTNGKIAGKQSETGVADIDIALGYRFLDGCTYGAALALAITIPTGNEADGIYMFEPLVGNGKHFGLGGDLCGYADAWGDMDHNIKIHLKMKYRYLFENSEKRTIGIQGRPFGQYFLLATAGAAINTQLTPAANITTLNVDVTPGSQFDGILGFAYNNCGFSFDAGYNMYFREAESVKIKDTLPTNMYAIASRGLNTAAAGISQTFAIAAQLDGGATPLILSNSTLDASTAETPSQFTHSVYGSLGYIFKEWENPFMLAVGGKYEIPSKNSALEQWNVWVKAGIGF